MLNKSIVHILTKSRMQTEEFLTEIEALSDLTLKYGIKNIFFYKGDLINNLCLIKKLDKFHVVFKNYSNKSDLKNQIIELSKQLEIIYITTILELLVNTVNELKKELGHSLSDDSNIFRNKFLQRDLIQKHNKELGIKFIKGTPENLDLKLIEKKVGYPFMLKPVDGVQSSGVAKINDKEDFQKYLDEYKDFHDRLKVRGVDNKELIVEEFIDGNIYSIDYFVTNYGIAHISKPVKVRLGIDVGVNDYCNIARIITEKTEGEFKGKRLKAFVNSTVLATGIRNTFVHHEFKINSKGELKTIELNGRIGGGRLELLKRAYDFNLYELLIGPVSKPFKLKESNIAVNIYATKRGILKSFNAEVFNEIKSRDSVFDIKYDLSVIGKEVGLTKDGFIKIGVIKLKNINYSVLREDFNYIKSIYKDLLDIDVFKK
ncbi:MAG: ATP-grasp domain-containing protein [Candidatus Gracilibacteria bacterium]|nr:ATP-grasp domain-containing protein [Candidatus Gracilibacteria bacterium]